MSFGLDPVFGATSRESFPNPFIDVAASTMPVAWRSALYWSEMIYLLSGTYRNAVQRVISYFMTDIEIEKASDDEQQKWKKLYTQDLGIFTELPLLLNDKACFHGDVKAVTQDGVFRLRDLAGKKVNVLSKGGKYRSAEFKSFGRQELLEVVFSDGRTVLATAEHEWIARNCSDKDVRVPTSQLREGYKIPRVVAPRPDQDDDYFEGVRHGFTFCDGNRYNHGKQAVAAFYGEKAEMLPFFEGHGCSPVGPDDRGRIAVHGLPPHYKALPPNASSASYWYGFVCGFLAADGSTDIYGCAVLTQKSKATLAAIASQLPRIGMAGGPVRGHNRKSRFVRKNGRIDHYEGKMHYVTLLKQFMQPQDFLRAKQRKRFVKNFKPTKYGEYVGVKTVRRTGIVDEVFCCVEPETHSFVIDQAVLTGNCYGNGFSSMIFPFRRTMICPKCHNVWNLAIVYNNKQFRFRLQGTKFMAKCPNSECNYQGEWKVKDHNIQDPEKVKIKRWSPHEIEILHDMFTEDVVYRWRIPDTYRQDLRKGGPEALMILERLPLEALDCLVNRRLYEFEADQIFHFKEPTISGFRTRGWGLPKVISQYRQLYYLQVLRRQNEAIGLDYVIPIRLVTPGGRNSGSGFAEGAMNDIVSSFNGDEARALVLKMIKNRRHNPAGWEFLPFPVDYRVLGGDANALAPFQLIEQAKDDLLNEADIPVELYKGTLQLQAAPVSIRLFQATNYHIVYLANAYLRWVAKRVALGLNWESVEPKLKPVGIADDLQKQLSVLQLMAQQQISPSTGLRILDMDYRQEQRQIVQDQRYAVEQQTRGQEEMQQAGFAAQIAKGQMPGQPGQGQGDPSQQGGQGSGGQPGSGGAQPGQPQPGATGMPVTDYLSAVGQNSQQSLEDVANDAQQLASQLAVIPETTRRGQLQMLRTAKPTLHSLVIAQMAKVRSQARSQGQAIVLGQGGQQGGGQPGQ